jgi:endonuclease/exonuclease/phosphatase (EEP) superfamily protein YafD
VSPGPPSPIASAGQPTDRETGGVDPMGVTTWLATGAAASWAVLRLLELPFPLNAAIAFTPYAAVGAWAPVAVAVARRRWVVTAMAVAAALALSAPVAARGVPSVTRAAAPPADGPTLRVLAVNLYFGAADLDTVVEEVTRGRVDVLTVLELDEHSVEAIDGTAVADVLPHRYLLPLDGGRGSGIYSRFPLHEIGDVGADGVMRMPHASIDVPGAAPVEVVAVHPLPPSSAPATAGWRAGLASLPRSGPEHPIRILAGDFNATLDHAELRSVVERGYTHAGSVTGQGLRPTWPTDRRFPPPVSIDHILVDRRASVLSFDVVELPGSDHRGVYAELRLPPTDPTGH